MNIYDSRMVFLWIQVSLYPSWAAEARSETLRTSQKVPPWSVSWPHNPARAGFGLVIMMMIIDYLVVDYVKRKNADCINALLSPPGTPSPVITICWKRERWERSILKYIKCTTLLKWFTFIIPNISTSYSLFTWRPTEKKLLVYLSVTKKAFSGPSRKARVACGKMRPETRL